MVTATEECTSTFQDLVALLSDGDAPVSEVLDQISEQTLAIAWAAGKVEFGRIKHCTTGNVQVPESKPTLIIEDGIVWSGEKKKYHQRFRDLYADSKVVPEYRIYKKYVSEKAIDGTVTWKTVEIERAEAVGLLALRVQLTDKGLGESQY